jgi:hypothetical protein
MFPILDSVSVFSFVVFEVVPLSISNVWIENLGSLLHIAHEKFA